MTSGWAVRRMANLLQNGWPFLLFESFNWVFNYPFMYLCLWHWGPAWGAIIPSVLAIAINAFIFWLYEYMKVDWLKAHAVRQLADKANKTRLEKILTWHLKPRKTMLEKACASLQFGLLLSQLDPVIVAVHYRESHFNGLTTKDWWLLIKATLSGLLIWLLVLEPTVLGIQSLWSH